MSETIKRIGMPKQSVYTVEEFIELIKEGLPRGSFVIDCDGKGNIKFARIEKQWIQKLGGM